MGGTFGACSLIYVLARREARFYLDDVVYAAALTIGCGRKDLCEPSEIPLRQTLR